MVKGTIFDIKRYAIHDGPGIRTTVFMKGCPLRCWWCHNPEGISPRPQLMYLEYKCIHCHTCVNVCPLRAITFDENEVQHIDREKCDVCGVCAEFCPTSALKLVGMTITVDELMKEVERDVNLYDSSGGGVTFSGGEPIFQPKFLVEALKASKERQINTALDTSGYAPLDVLKKVEPLVDVFLYDLKLFDEEEHIKYTGVSNKIIKRNLEFLVKIGRAKDVFLRFPVIPGITDTERNVSGWTRFVSSLGGFERIHLLPFHDVSEKYRRLGMEYRMPTREKPSEETMKRIAEEFEEVGLEVVSGG
ncbi:MAG: pyruvate formate lyase activating enzyme [Thermococcaceae archaeon]|nr:pyruvate formate lyase activating enzyme [Thermococcaceae archaeon]